MKIIRNRLAKLLFHYDWEILELKASILTTWWGLILLYPTSSLRPVGPMTAIFPEAIWGLIITSIGVGHFLAVYSFSVPRRRLWLMVSLMFWLFSCIISWLAVPFGFGAAMTTITSVFLIINYLRLGMIRRDDGR